MNYKIGNYVHSKNNRTVKITLSNIQDSNKYSPIEFSKGTIDKLGWKNTTKDIWIEDESLSYYSIIKTSKGFNLLANNTLVVQLKYVHQFQDIYEGINLKKLEFKNYEYNGI